MPTKKPSTRNSAPIAIAIGVVVLTAIVVILSSLKVSFWMATPAEKMAVTWSNDLRLLESSRKLPPQWRDIKEVSVKADNSEIQNWLKDLHPDIPMIKTGNFRLEVFLVFFIEGYRYGVVTNYHLVDLRNNNTVWEDGRTFKLGIVY